MNPFLPLPEVLSKNPFAAAHSNEVPANAPEGSYTYALVQSAPAVPAEECEVNAASIEIMIRWGATTLHVAHLTPPRAFVVGEASEKNAVDFGLPAERLGCERLPIVRKAADGSSRAVIPMGAKGTATVAGQVVKVSDLASKGHAEQSTEFAGAIELPLRASTNVRFEVGGIEIEIASVNAGRKVSGRFSFDRRGLPFQAVSMALHLGLLGAAAVFMPPSALASEDSVQHDQIEAMKMFLSANAERELPESKDQPDDKATGERDGGTGHGAVGESGKMGSTTSNNTNGKWGAAGPKDNKDVQLSKADAIAMARDFGLVGLLNAGLAGDPKAPTTPWGDVATLGRDPISAKGNMWGSDIAEAAGGGGLGLTGVGEGGGMDGHGIGMGRIGTYGHGNGLGDGDGFGPGSGSSFANGRRGHKQADLSMRTGETKTNGHLPPEVIQRVVRQNFGRFRLCYENGLRGNPNLAGRVGVRFVIGRDGGVMSSANGGSDLPDPGVVSCVVAAFRGLQFPQSEEGGAVTVTYPIMFSPAGK
ncbi:MAG: AgmX/PglI C-terminal domain-containing protein [Polyangiaceae bacterium]|nr:AgmX/PglI C-terminal domain-containing protein [Polyangiaceae bacterium]